MNRHGSGDRMDMIRKELKQDGFTKDQIDEIKAGIAQGLDVKYYAKREFLSIQMREIRLGLEKELPVKIYASPKYDWFQMEQIRLGLEEGVDISVYASSDIPHDRMKQLRLGLGEGIDLSHYDNLSVGVLKQLRLALHDHINIMSYILSGYDAEQLEEIRLALGKQLPIDGFVKPELRGIALREIFLGLEHGIDPSVYCNEEYNWQQMREIRLGMEHMIDIAVYSNSFYSSGQMREIRLGLEAGLEVSYYASLMFTPDDMKKRRMMLEKDPTAWAKRQLEEVDELLANVMAPASQDEKMHYRITVSADGMEAYIEIDDAVKHIDKIEIVRELSKYGICYGVDYDAIDAIVRKNRLRKPCRIAVGKAVSDGEDGWYEFFFRTDVARTPKCLDDGTIDYRDVEWFETVKKGQKLAVYHEAKPGEDGITVTGKTCTARRGKEKSILIGKGFSKEEDGKTYISEHNGIVTITGSVLNITELLVMKDVNLATGDVSYIGSVLVEGNVSSGSKIRAGGDVVVKGFVEAAEIQSGGCVFLRQGMNAAGSGTVHAAKDVIGYFFEGAKVFAGGDIRGDYFLNSNIHAEGEIFVTGKKGSFVGGSAFAERGLHAHSVGNQAGVVTYVKLGVIERIIKKEDELNRKICKINQELLALHRAHNDYKKAYDAEVRNTMELYLKVESAVYTKEKQIEALMRKKGALLDERKKAENVQAVVDGHLYEGVLVDIDGAKWNAKTVKAVTLKRAEKRIAVFSKMPFA